MNGRARSDAFGRRLDRWIQFAFLAVVPLVLAGLALWFGSEYRRLGGSEVEAQRVHARQLALSELLSAMKDVETGQRGYVITGDESFLEPYRGGEAQVRRQLTELRATVTDSADAARLDRLRALIDAKFAEMARVLAARRTAGLASAASLVSEGHGKRLMDAIRIEAARAGAIEGERLARTLARQDARTRLTQRIIWLVVIVTALAFIALALIFRRNAQAQTNLARAAEEAGARRRAIFDSTLDAIVLINPSGSIETINQAAVRLLGHPEESLIRRDISLVADLAPGDGPFLDRIGLGPDGLAEPFRHNLAARRADGSTLPVEAALSVMPLPDGIHIVAVLRDISEREKVERIKDQFLSTVSHELRTPLTSIVGSLGLLRGGASGDLAPGAQRLLVIAENNAHRLIRLVNDLLDVEKFESGQMAFDFAPMDLREAAAKALDAVRAIAQEREVALVPDEGAEPVVVRGDAERLIQVMTNLLANAVRFTPAGGKVTLAIARRANHADVLVTDEGPGIDEELRARLFTRFAQSIQAPAGTARGTGLGLAISREIVRAHGGSIWYEPAAGGGSQFAFSLPLWNTVTDQPDTRAAPRVLIHAGEAEAARIVAALENRAIRADVIHDTEAMFEALRRDRYLALLLDCQNIGADGTLLRRIRGQPGARRLPVIAISAGDDDDSDLGLLDLVDWIPRPLDSRRLNEALVSVMQRVAGKMPLVLHVDDDTDTLELTAAALEGRARMARAHDIASARAFIAQNRLDALIIDLALPDGSGEELIADLSSSSRPAPPVIIYSAQERNGAFASEVAAVLTKSKRGLSGLVETIDEILDRRAEEGASDER